jgi:hypothetical protein
VQLKLPQKVLFRTAARIEPLGFQLAFIATALCSHSEIRERRRPVRRDDSRYPSAEFMRLLVGLGKIAQGGLQAEQQVADSRLALPGARPTNKV